MSHILIRGDARRLPLADALVDAIITDPPAGISFMGKEWDDFCRRRNPADSGRDNVFGRTSRSGPEYGRRPRDAFVAFLSTALAECLRVAKPGSILLCWAIPRTSHWTGTAIEDAGWLIEDRIAHHFGSGFPKHKSKLKPATEDWWLARKPGPKWLGVEACRVGTEPRFNPCAGNQPGGHSLNLSVKGMPRAEGKKAAGRWAPNLVLSHSPECKGECVEGCPVRLMGEQSGERPSGIAHERNAAPNQGYSGGWNRLPRETGYCDSGTAARFFPHFDPDPFLYAAKASRAERNRGCEGMEPGANRVNAPRACEGEKFSPSANHHPTVKPQKLMRWLCRLACPEGGVILDPFAGSGSTGCAATAEGFSFIGIEREWEYDVIASRRIEYAQFQEERPHAPIPRPGRDKSFTLPFGED